MLEEELEDEELEPEGRELEPEDDREPEEEPEALEGAVSSQPISAMAFMARQPARQSHFLTPTQSFVPLAHSAVTVI